MFYAPLHYLLIQAVLRATGAAAHRLENILDLGCGTGVAGALWALEAKGRVRVLGVERNAWAASEARWSWQVLGVKGAVREGDLDRIRVPARPGGIVAAFTVNELDPARRVRLRDRLLRAAAGGASVLVVEPVAGRLVPWWGDWQARFEASGGESAEWRFAARLPGSLRLMDRAAGLDHRTLSGRSLWLPPDGPKPTQKST
jgi:SAM-dependent methyltransferase